MAAGRHVDRVTPQVTDYDYPPLPGDFREAWVAFESVGGRIDREGPSTSSRTSSVAPRSPWTTSGITSLGERTAPRSTILIGLASGRASSSCRSSARLWPGARQVIGESRSDEPLTGEAASGAAREALARIQRVRSDLVTVDEVEPAKRGRSVCASRSPVGRSSPSRSTAKAPAPPPSTLSPTIRRSGRPRSRWPAPGGRGSRASTCRA